MTISRDQVDDTASIAIWNRNKVVVTLSITVLYGGSALRSTSEVNPFTSFFLKNTLNFIQI
jgi:hypothetical protein